VTQGIFVQTNDNQLIGAKVAKFALETRGRARERGVPVTIMNVSKMPLFGAFAGACFRRGSRMPIYDPHELQSFTLSRFMPPELMGFSGRALVIDPDVFALADVGELFATDLADNAVAACWGKYGWDSSVMLLDCARLTHWKISDILGALENLSSDYLDLIRLRTEPKVLELPSEWNSHDKVGPETKMRHMTRVQTQPWKTGLPLDYLPTKSPPLFGFIPRRLFVKPITHYQPHPEREVERVFMTLLTEALAASAVTEEDITDAIAHKFVRADLRKQIA